MLLRQVPWAGPLIDWWQLSSSWDGMNGQPSGPPEWPLAGGLLNQPARLVEAVTLLRMELPHVRESRRGGA